jgi:catechol 2,3-dioxygenase-like lactoylglutathione lyase family enzyme
VDERPPVWIGHAVLTVSDVGRSARWWHDIGMREIEENAHVAVLELRGGTHLVLVLDADARTDGRTAPFDLMADDLDALHDAMEARGIDVSAIERGPHAHFTFPDADGYVVTVNDSHVVGAV